MRVIVVTLLLVLPSLAVAQSSRAVTTNASPSLPTIGLPLQQIGLPLQQIGLPLPQMGLPQPVPEPPSPRAPIAGADRRPDGRVQHRGDNRNRGHARQNSIIYFVPAFGFPYDGATPSATSTAASVDAARELSEPTRPTGTLWLDVQPSGGQLHVDTYFVGTTDDTGGELTLEPGAHAVEVRVPGFEPLFLNVKIEADRAITYRAALRPLPASVPDQPLPQESGKPPTARRPIYFIAGCYLGDVPPAEANLPATCDLKRAIVVRP